MILFYQFRSLLGSIKALWSLQRVEGGGVWRVTAAAVIAAAVVETAVVAAAVVESRWNSRMLVV